MNTLLLTPPEAHAEVNAGLVINCEELSFLLTGLVPICDPRGMKYITPFLLASATHCLWAYVPTHCVVEPVVSRIGLEPKSSSALSLAIALKKPTIAPVLMSSAKTLSGYLPAFAVAGVQVEPGLPVLM